MIQLVFDAADGRGRRSRRTPVEVGYSQHEGAERADVGRRRSSSSSTARTRSSTRPTARTRTSSARRSTSAARPQEGVGCDDTRGPTVDVRPVVRTIPSDAAAARGRVPVDRVRGPLGRAAAGVLQRPDRPEPEDAVDAADRVGRRTGATGATPFPAAALFGTDGDRLLLRRRRRTARRSLVRLVDEPGRVQPRPRRARPRSSSSCSRGRRGGRPRRSASHAGAPGADPRGRRRACTPRGSPLFVGIGVLFVPISLARHAPAGARPARDEHPRGPDRRREQRGLLAFVVLAIGTVADAARARPRRRRRRRGRWSRSTQGRRDRAARRLPAGRSTACGRCSGRC